MILNLGCGTKASAHPDVVNIDWSIYLHFRTSPLLRPLAPLFIRGERRARFDALPDNILVHDLATGIPFPSDSIDVVYHSHVLEHLDRNVANTFLTEVKRVLKPGGIHRIVVPDFERAVAEYARHLAQCERDPAEMARHDDYVAGILEQSVQREAYGTSLQRPIRRFLENALLGDARRRGQTHQWMYDRFNLSARLAEAGYRDPRRVTFDTSSIAGWERYGLDRDAQGNEFRPGSLYLEATK